MRPAARRPTTSKPHAAAARAQTTAHSNTSGRTTACNDAPSNERATTSARSTAWARTSNAATSPRTASAASAIRASRARSRRRRSNAAIRSGRGRRLPADPGPEDVVGPSLVEQDERHADRGDDGHDGQRVVGRGGTLDGQAVREVGARDHHPRVEGREERGDKAERPDGAEGEPDAAPASVNANRR